MTRVRALLPVVLLMLGGCATQPLHINNVCSVFHQRGGWFNNWYEQASRVSEQFGVPVSILMATIRIESAYRSDAQPPRTELLGFIPWTRVSSAYGYAQALDSTWEGYQQATGRPGAERDEFDDAVHFVGWYHHRSHVMLGIPLDDAYSLYLAYYLGRAGYRHEAWVGKPGVLDAASRMASMAKRYRRQIRRCQL